MLKLIYEILKFFNSTAIELVTSMILSIGLLNKQIQELEKFRLQEVKQQPVHVTFKQMSLHGSKRMARDAWMHLRAFNSP